MQRIAGTWGRLVVILAGGLATGCGASPAEVTGRITYKGRPVQVGWVLILGADGAPHYGTLGPDGRYAVAGVRSGPVRLAVASPSPEASTELTHKKEAALRKWKGTTAPAPAAASDWFPLPDRYGDPNRSGLTKELRPGANVIDLDLD